MQEVVLVFQKTLSHKKVEHTAMMRRVCFNLATFAKIKRVFLASQTKTFKKVLPVLKVGLTSVEVFKKKKDS